MTTPPLNLRPVTPPGSPSAHDFSYETSPHLYLFTSLTAGSSHIITATSRLETILKANRIAFKAVDCATDEKARRIWSRRAGKRKLPGLVQQGVILADLETVEEWNEFGEIKQHLGGGAAVITAPQAQAQNQNTTAAAGVIEGAAVEPIGASTTSVEEKPAAMPETVAASAMTAAAPSAQQIQQQQQSSLAREVAAKAAERTKNKANATKLKFAGDPGTTSSSTTETPETTSAPATTPPQPIPNATPAGTENKHPGSPPRSPEMDQDYDMSEAKHNTSSTAALPPLSIRTHNNASPPSQIVPAEKGEATRGRSDTASSISSPSMPSVPPPSAIEPSDSATSRASDFSASSIDAALARRDRDATPQKIAQIEKKDSIPEVDETLTSPDNDDGEATEQGDAEEDDNDLESVDTPHSPFEQRDDYSGQITTGADLTREGSDESTGISRGDGGGKGSLADALALREIESGEESPRLYKKDPSAHVKWEEDQIKGDAKAADRAGESVGD